ncbi:MAG: aminotransferase class I/II-fold pyridoxal phosphate-dependent enzyme [Planctomycetes bacterium]|nr:aminotransferase class I/II-fold pyridoxal phosphate-dependent enzyme [Planctomycetota bacterium]
MAGRFALADRMALIDASGIRKVFDLAATMKDPINLSIGQPDFDVPEEAKREAIDAIARGFNKYTQTQGDGPLREAIRGIIASEFGWGADYGHLVTSGVSGALVLAFLALLNEGDEVIIPDPYFVMYRHLVNLYGGVPVTVDTYPDFRPDPARIEAAITDRTRVLVLNSPANPTGAVYTQTELEALAAIARKHDLLVISDEIYDAFCYDGPFASIAPLYPNTLVMRGFSKTYAMTGWRLGWCAGPKHVIEAMTMLQQYSFVCAPSMAQAAGVVALSLDVGPYVEAYRRKRDRVVDALGESFGLIRPGGAFYAFVPAPQGQTATEFVRKAIANNVLIIPGNVFSAADTHFRLSYATSDDKLARGLDILRSLA